MRKVLVILGQLTDSDVDWLPRASVEKNSASMGSMFISPGCIWRKFHCKFTYTPR